MHTHQQTCKVALCAPSMRKNAHTRTHTPTRNIQTQSNDVDDDDDDALLLDNMIHQIVGESPDLVTQCLGHLGKSLCLHLMLEWKCRKYGSFSMNCRLDQSACTTYCIQWHGMKELRLLIFKSHINQQLSMCLQFRVSYNTIEYTQHLVISFILITFHQYILFLQRLLKLETFRCFLPIVLVISTFFIVRMPPTIGNQDILIQCNQLL